MNKPGTASTIIEAFELAQLPSRAKRPLLVGPQILTYPELSDRCKRLTRLFHEAGLSQGDCVILAVGEDVDLITLFLSLLRNGITAVVVDPDLKKQRFVGVYETTNPKGIILDADLASYWEVDNCDIILEVKGKAEQERTSLFDTLLGRDKKTRSSQTPLAQLLDDVLPMEAPSEVDPLLDAYVLFTSGTMASPKGVRITHKNMFSHMSTLSQNFGYDESSRILDVLTLVHTDGLIQGPSVAFANGATLYRPFTFDITNIPALLDSIYKDRITHFISVPTMLALIDKLGMEYRDCFDTDDFQFIVSCAAFLETNLWQEFESNFNTQIVNLYGLTETVTGGLFAGPAEETRRVGTVGKPIDCTVRLIDESGDDVGRGEIGELLLKGDSVFNGYLNADDATDEVLRKGWFSTGDLFRQDEDGFYIYAGRKKSLIISGGFNVFPDEVTEVLNQAPRVLESVTYGVPDDIWGEQVVSCAVLKAGGEPDTKPLFDYLHNHLEAVKVPAQIHLLDQLPRTASGKVIVSDVKRIVDQAKDDIRQMLPHGDVFERVIEVCAAHFNVPTESLSQSSSPTNTKSWDSLAHLGMVVAIETSFSVSLSTDEIMRIENLANLVQIIEAKL